MYKQANIAKRGPGLASTHITNELAEHANGNGPPFHVGQVAGDDPFPRRDIVLVKLTSAATGVGRYNGRMSDMVINLEATGALAEANLGTFATADDTIVWLMSDAAQSSNSVTTFSPAPYVLGWLVDTNDAGKKIVIVPRGGGGSLPSGTGRYKVVQVIDTLSPGTLGIDYLRFP
ncbi:MAG TPA: hypothetical protein VGN72_01125 [Tepidisphaeraceae bacterium]|jgi:hypothetical protein|nr:hypothetical protein [Tepidisphaeraceae bacterium]